MREYTFRFYKNEKHITTRTLHHRNIENAYKEADNILRQTRNYDDWEYIEPKTTFNIEDLPKTN